MICSRFEDIARYSQHDMRLGELYPTVGAVYVGPVLHRAVQPKQNHREEFSRFSRQGNLLTHQIELRVSRVTAMLDEKDRKGLGLIQKGRHA